MRTYLFAVISFKQFTSCLNVVRSFLVCVSSLFSSDTNSPQGTSNKRATCETCGLRLADCIGHFGYIRLVLPCFHVGFLKATVNVLSMVCKDCSRVLLPPNVADLRRKQLRSPELELPRRRELLKDIQKDCAKCRTCPYCQRPQGDVRRVGALKIVHKRYKVRLSMKTVLCVVDFGLLDSSFLLRIRSFV